jgi:hypothetical protein
MRVVELDAASGEAFAWCEGQGMNGTLRRERLNVLWLGEVSVGDWVYAILGQARERLSAERAAEISLALSGLAAALQGEVSDPAQLEAYFPDLPRHQSP